jgi:hypothetical protein
MIRRTGNQVLFSPITYFFANEADAEGFMKCVKGVDGKPSTCAVKWHCVSEQRLAREPAPAAETAEAR